MPFGQLVIGPPGSGKSTYCNALQQLLGLLGRRAAVVNLDPANDALPYEAAIDVAELVSLASVMDALHLGPNGGLVYCMSYLESNADWLLERLEPLVKEGAYLVFDCPGQVELFVLHGSLKAVLRALDQRLHLRLVAVELVDAHLCTDAGKYVAALLLSLGSMLHLELPHLNLLSKADLAAGLGGPDFDLDDYAEVGDLSLLLAGMEEAPGGERYRRLTAAIAEVVEDFSLVGYLPLAVEDKESMLRVLQAADKAVGYVDVGREGRTAPSTGSTPPA